MEQAFEILKTLDSISLGEMNKVKLLDRLDKKYMFHVDQLPEILALARKDYYALEIDGKKYAGYNTTYYDTPDFEMYTKHHNGKLNRYKVRFRTYIDSNINFFEIKFKTNKGRTKKSRIQLPESDHIIHGEEAEKLLERKTPYTSPDLIPALLVNYNRITLVNRNMTERITIDFLLNYKHGDNRAGYPSLIIAEVKQDKSDSSPFINIMQEKRIKSASISKYCLGIASTVKDIKINNFKIKIKYVNQLFSKSA